MQASVNKEPEDILAHRLDFPVAVFQGCTLVELLLLGSMTFICLAFIFCVITTLLFGLLMLGLGLAAFATLYVTKILAKIVGRYKEGKPQGYVKQRFLLWCQRQGFYQTPYIRYSGRWTILRIKS